MAKTKRRTRNWQADPAEVGPSAVEVAILLDRPMPTHPTARWEALGLYSPEAQKTVWEAHRAALLAAWIEDHPGTRPAVWWRVEAPEPRQRLGGVGNPAPPPLWRGAPRYWCGAPDTQWREMDPEDPPVYESQAEYLRRHALLSVGELERLTPAEFEPETITHPREET
jgi:hypothetical protein